MQHYKSGGRFDEHWSPIYQFCTPCSINFTLIAKMETFQRDTEYIIRQAGLETLLLDKVPKMREQKITNRSLKNDTNLQISKWVLGEFWDIFWLKTFQILFANRREPPEPSSRNLSARLRSFRLRQLQILRLGQEERREAIAGHKQSTGFWHPRRQHKKQV